MDAHMILVFSLVSFINADNRELIPQKAPSNLTLLEISERQVVIKWDPIDPETIRGRFKGYLVRTWNPSGSQVYAFSPEVTKASVEFFPFSTNFITVSARNERYVGPPSEAISFDAPQIEPNHPFALNVFTLSNKSIFIQWNKPTESNGILLGYKIYCSEINQTHPEAKVRETAYPINDPDKLQAKLTGLVEGVKYKISVSALNCAGESDVQTAEVTMSPHTPAKPFPSKFIFKINYTTTDRDGVCHKTSPTSLIFTEEEADKEEEEVDYYDYLIKDKKETKATEPPPKPTKSSDSDYEKRCLVDCMVMWLPDVRNNPGEYFYLKYKLKGEKEYQVTEPEMSEDNIILKKFDACRNYEIALVAVDGEYSTESGILLTPTKVF